MSHRNWKIEQSLSSSCCTSQVDLEYWTIRNLGINVTVAFSAAENRRTWWWHSGQWHDQLLGESHKICVQCDSIYRDVEQSACDLNFWIKSNKTKLRDRRQIQIFLLGFLNGSGYPGYLLLRPNVTLYCGGTPGSPYGNPTSLACYRVRCLVLGAVPVKPFVLRGLLKEGRFCSVSDVPKFPRFPICWNSILKSTSIFTKPLPRQSFKKSVNHSTWSRSIGFGEL